MDINMADINQAHGRKRPFGQALDGSPANGSARARAGASARKGAEAVRTAADAAGETPRRNTRATAESRLRMAEEAALRFEEARRKTAGATGGNTADPFGLLAMPNAAEGGVRDLQQSMAGLVEGVVRTNLRMAQELFRRDDPASVAALQQRFMREYMDALLQGSAALAHAVRRIADETPRPLEEQGSQKAAE
jgi:hypothetical protein